jgi:hypothetical protein
VYDIFTDEKRKKAYEEYELAKKIGKMDEKDLEKLKHNIED